MSYFLYFDEFYEAAVSDIMNEAMMITEAEKEGVFKNNYCLRDNLQLPYVHNVLAKDVTKEKIIEFVGKFMEDHTKQLSTPGPVYSFTFSTKEAEFFYTMFNVNAQMLLDLYAKVSEETYYGKISKIFTGWIQNAPHKLLITAILVDALQNNYEDIVECCKYIWAFSEYPILFSKSWPLGVQPDVMNYTIEHLGSKFKIVQKKMQTLKDLIYYHADVSVTAHADRLKTGADNTYFDFMYRMRNQMKNSLQNIAREYYVNSKKNNTLHQKDSTFDDGSLADQEGHTTNMGQIIENTYNKFITNGINSTMVKIAADNCQVDKGNLTGYINQIWAVKDNKLYSFIENVITIYFTKNPTNSGITGGEFVNFGLSLYRSLGTKEKMYQDLRSILDYWMFNIIDIRKTYSNTGTITAYTRAIFNYIILMIMHYN